MKTALKGRLWFKGRSVATGLMKVSFIQVFVSSRAGLKTRRSVFLSVPGQLGSRAEACQSAILVASAFQLVGKRILLRFRP